MQAREELKTEEENAVLCDECIADDSADEDDIMKPHQGGPSQFRRCQCCSKRHFSSLDAPSSRCSKRCRYERMTHIQTMTSINKNGAYQKPIEMKPPAIDFNTGLQPNKRISGNSDGLNKLRNEEDKADLSRTSNLELVDDSLLQTSTNEAERVNAKTWSGDNSDTEQTKDEKETLSYIDLTDEKKSNDCIDLTIEPSCFSRQKPVLLGKPVTHKSGKCKHDLAQSNFKRLCDKVNWKSHGTAEANHALPYAAANHSSMGMTLSRSIKDGTQRAVPFSKMVNDYHAILRG